MRERQIGVVEEDMSEPERDEMRDEYGEPKESENDNLCFPFFTFPQKRANYL